MSAQTESTAVQPTGRTLAPQQLREATQRAWLNTLCHKLQTVHETRRFQTKDRGQTVDVVAEMVCELVGLSVPQLYEIFDYCGTDGEELFMALDPLLYCHRACDEAQPREAVRSALLNLLCQKLPVLFERHIICFRDLDRADSVELVAEMLGNLVGLNIEEVFEVFDSCKGVAEMLFLRLEPRLAADCGSWMIP